MPDEPAGAASEDYETIGGRGRIPPAPTKFGVGTETRGDGTWGLAKAY
jgi:hypothetical protein